MSINESFNHSIVAVDGTEINLPRSVRFWLLLLFDIPSVICSFFLLFHLLSNRVLRLQLTNHVMIILLIIGLIFELIDIPFHLSFLHFGVVYPSTTGLCLLWLFIDIGLCTGCIVIMACGSIQRYLLIFYDRFFLTKKKRIIFHYIPLVILLTYVLVFYIIAIFFPPCVNTYSYNLPMCDDYLCYFDDPALGLWDSIGNNILSIFIMIIFSSVLIIRVYYQKRRLNQANIWRRQRKMTIQLLGSCVLYLTPNIPLNIFVIARLFGLSEDVGVQAELYVDFLGYFVILLYPFLCLASLPELHNKIPWRRLLLARRPQQMAAIRPQ